jgi:hypothetical protein
MSGKDDSSPGRFHIRSTAMDRPSKHFRLTAWRILYHVPVEKILDRQDEIDACRHARLDLARWDEMKARWPHEWSRLLAKRQRRLDWFKQHGSIEPGWCPPDANDRRTANRPVRAYLARRGWTMVGYEAAEAGHCRNKGPSTHVVERVTRWRRG